MTRYDFRMRKELFKRGRIQQYKNFDSLKRRYEHQRRRSRMLRMLVLLIGLIALIWLLVSGISFFGTP